MSIVYRHANSENAHQIADIAIMTAGGISDFLLQGLFSNSSVNDVLRLVILDEKNPMSYLNTLVAVDDDKVIAATNYYPSDQHGVHTLVKGFIPVDRLEHMKNFYNSRVKDSLYIHTLGVIPKYRHTSAAMDLCQLLRKIAIDKGLKYLSAHVWADNLPVFAALRFAGFTVVENVDIKRHELLPHDGGMLLMRSPELT